MTQPDFDATRYLQNAGRESPDCLLESIWHEHHVNRTLAVNEGRLLLFS
jgi:hypothetical protein